MVAKDAMTKIAKFAPTMPILAILATQVTTYGLVSAIRIGFDFKYFNLELY